MGSFLRESSMKHSVNIILLGLFLNLCHGLPTDLDGKPEFSPELRNNSMPADEIAELEHELELQLEHELEVELKLEQQLAELAGMESTPERKLSGVDLSNGGDMDIADRFWWLFISEKTKSFYCPDGSTFYSKSKDLRMKTKSSCSSSCWSRADGCSASIFTTLMNKQFEGSCDIHDLCYAQKGKYKHTCDNEFYNNMKDQCRSENYPLGCFSLAWGAYTAVKNASGAQYGYEQGQNSNC